MSGMWVIMACVSASIVLVAWACWRLVQPRRWRTTGTLIIAGGVLMWLAALLSFALYVERMPSWAVVGVSCIVVIGGYLGLGLSAFMVHARKNSHGDIAAGCDVVVVLGAGLVGERVSALLAARLDRGLQLALAGGADAIVCSGGQGADEVISEAAAMARYLSGKVPEYMRVILEDSSTTTEENLRFSSQLITADVNPNAQVVVATSNYHVLRTRGLARRARLDWPVYGAPSVLWFFPTSFLREYAAVLVFHWRFHAAVLGGLCAVMAALAF